MTNARDSGDLFSWLVGLGDFRATRVALWFAAALSLPLADSGPQLDALGPNPRCFFRWTKSSKHEELSGLTLADLVTGLSEKLSGDQIWFSVSDASGDIEQGRLDILVDAMLVQFLICKVVECIEFLTLGSVWRDAPRGPKVRE